MGASTSSEYYPELSTEELKLYSSQILYKEICRIFVAWYEQYGYFTIIYYLVYVVVSDVDVLGPLFCNRVSGYKNCPLIVRADGHGF